MRTKLKTTLTGAILGLTTLVMFTAAGTNQKEKAQ